MNRMYLYSIAMLLSLASLQAEEPTKPATDTPAGEDLNFGSAQDPFAEVARNMQRSQESLGKRELSEAANTLRGEIVSDLDKLLNKMQQQCQGGQCNKPGDGKPGGASKPGKTGKSPASDSTKRVDKPTSGENQSGDEADIIREVWGHLPPKLREAMQNASLEEYLPKYEQHIREYYRRLAEESRTGVK